MCRARAEQSTRLRRSTHSRRGAGLPARTTTNRPDCRPAAAVGRAPMYYLITTLSIWTHSQPSLHQTCFPVICKQSGESAGHCGQVCSRSTSSLLHYLYVSFCVQIAVSVNSYLTISIHLTATKAIISRMPSTPPAIYASLQNCRFCLCILFRASSARPVICHVACYCYSRFVSFLSNKPG